VINPELLGPVGGEVFGDELDQVISDLRLGLEDGVLTVKHGIVRAGPERTPGYLLDFDYFLQAELEDPGVAQVVDRFDRYHNVIYPLFRWCLTEEATHAMRRGWS
jgi:uncharacterized protein (TIGR04255 family)